MFPVINYILLLKNIKFAPATPPKRSVSTLLLCVYYYREKLFGSHGVNQGPNKSQRHETLERRSSGPLKPNSLSPQKKSTSPRTCIRHLLVVAENHPNGAQTLKAPLNGHLILEWIQAGHTNRILSVPP